MESKIDHYEVLELIGQGGMGEVYLVYDPICDRKVALKKIRKDFLDNEVLKKRFVREAKIAGNLVHPGVVPVYHICNQDPVLYYTMPYINGYTLKSLLKKVWLCEDIPKDLEEITSISSFLPIFHKICCTIEYVHSKDVLHRDLKPDNIFLGSFGEVLILDWGAAVDKRVDEDKNNLEDTFTKDMLKKQELHVTIPGKIVGTPDYMAPERLLGSNATESSDIYALGIILYQMLTLSFPFKKRMRGVKSLKSRSLLLPEDVAPYREIPPFLSNLAMKCLSFDPKDRYQKVSDVRKDLTLYLGGEPEYVAGCHIVTSDNSSWKYQENILLSKYFPFLKKNSSLWYNLAISKKSNFLDLILETTFSLSLLSDGFGLLFSINPEDWKHFNNGYGFWLYYENGYLTSFFIKNGIELKTISKPIDDHLCKVNIIIKKKQHRFSLSINGEVWIEHLGYSPSLSGHLGLIFQDLSLLPKEFNVLENREALKISCLAIPEAFLYEKLYDQAIVAYKNIANSFPGRKIESEARFGIGMTLLEKGKCFDDQDCLHKALQEFALLHNGVSPPLEYLGKSLVYEQLSEIDEEIKSLLLGLKRYFDHPEVFCLKERLIFRLKQSLYQNKGIAAPFMLVSLLTAPDILLCYEDSYFKLYMDDLASHTLFSHFNDSLERNRLLGGLLLLTYWSNQNWVLVELLEMIINQGHQNDLHILAFIAAELKDLKFLHVLFDACQNTSQAFSNAFDIHESTIAFIDVLIEILSLKTNKDTITKALSLPMVLQIYTAEVWFNHRLFYGDFNEIIIFLDELNKIMSKDVFDQYLLPKKVTIKLLQKDASGLETLFNQYDKHDLKDHHPELFNLYVFWLSLKGESHKEFFIVDPNEKKTPLLMFYESFGEHFVLDQLTVYEQKLLLKRKFIYYHCINDKIQKDLMVRMYQDLSL